AQRSVQIDILWGQTEPEEQNKLESYKNVIAKFDELNNKIVQKGLSTQIKFHRAPTLSHAKFIIHDEIQGIYSATLGSCNWLSSRFNRFEVSACITDDLIVADLTDICSHLSMGGTGLANNLSRELAVFSASLYKNVSIRKESDGNTSVQIISAPEHHPIVKQACNVV
ncbi:TPA: hypothetical protein NBI58_005296, partial [Klebsiella pneumoniae]|nr:hypothetical protein [Klebsiella pneumoniae]